MSYPQSFLDKRRINTLVDLLSERAIHQPKTVAYTFLVDGETSAIHLTYQELELRARAIATTLQSRLGRGASHHNSLAGDFQTRQAERVLLLYPPGLDYIAAFFGCLYAGLIAVPAYPPRPNNRSSYRLRAIAANSQTALVLTTQPYLATLERTLAHQPELKTLPWIATDSLDLSLAHAWQPPELFPHTLALLQYTSGSTAAPKGVMITHQNLLQNLKLIHHSFEHTDSSKGVIWLPPYHDMGLIGGVLQPLYGGFPVTLMSPLMFLQRPVRWLQAISHTQATTSGGPNFAYDLCVRRIQPQQLQGLDLSSWSVAFNGAEPIRPVTLERFIAMFQPYGFRPEALYPCYGMAEATLIISGGRKAALPNYKTINNAELAQNRVVAATLQTAIQPIVPQPPAAQLVGCGQTLSEQQIVIVHSEKLTACSEGAVGEIWVSGPSIAQGYWNQPEETKKTFQAYLANSGKGPFLRTGDLGFLSQGELFVTGRLKDLIIINGRNHYPQDIENTVEHSHPVIRTNACAAFSVNAEEEERLVILAELERAYRHHQKQKITSTVSNLTADCGVDTVARLEPTALKQTIQRTVSKQHNLQIHTVCLLKYGTIPKTSSGKIQRHLCRHQYLTKTLKVIA